MKLSVDYAEGETKWKYSLLSLPVDLLPMIDQIEIRGSLADSAVLCTPDKTFALRGVQSSNSILLCNKSEHGSVVVESCLNETLEVVPTRAKTDRTIDLLRGTDYTGEDSQPTRRVSLYLLKPCSELTDIEKVWLTELQSLLPASDAEILKSLRQYGAILLQGQARLVPPVYLRTLLTALLKSLPFSKADKVQISKEEAEMTFDSLDCGTEACHELIAWFGTISGETCTLEVKSIVREVGVCLLAEGGYSSRPVEPFITDWRSSVGPFSDWCDTDSLKTTALLAGKTITFYPVARLSPDPATRFGELFGARPKWKESELVPFLEDFGGKKERDKLVMKFVRKVREKDGEYWVSRNNWQ